MRRAIRGDFGGERAQNLKLVFILSLLGAQVLLGRSMPGGLAHWAKTVQKHILLIACTRIKYTYSFARALHELNKKK